MKNSNIKKAADILIPGIFLSGLTGCIAGIAVYCFKRLAALLAEKSAEIYAFATQNLWALPILFAGLFGLSSVSYFILKHCPSATGGGIPSSVGALRGMLNFHWLKTLIFTAVSALITFFSGVPLGNEGPSVQIGTALGKGISRHLGKRTRAWDRYIMSSGACAGFAAATCAPLSGALLSLEEAHQRFSPMILFSALTGVVSATVTNNVLTRIFGGDTVFIHLSNVPTLSLNMLPIAAIIGITAGISAVLYSESYKLFRRITEKLPLFAKISGVFLLTGVIGVFFPLALGNGHSVIEMLLDGEIIISVIVILLLLKFALTALASAVGVTGGLFIPILTIGALLGGIEVYILNLLGFEQSVFLPVILISIAAFLGSAMKTPFIAIVFSVEALFCGQNIIFVSTAVLCGYLVTELTKNESISEIVLSFRIKEQTVGARTSIEIAATVENGAFAEGKAIRDLFMPPNCVIVGIVRDGKERAVNNGEIVLHADDILNMHCITYDEDALKNDIDALFKA